MDSRRSGSQCAWAAGSRLPASTGTAPLPLFAPRVQDSLVLPRRTARWSILPWWLLARAPGATATPWPTGRFAVWHVLIRSWLKIEGLGDSREVLFTFENFYRNCLVHLKNQKVFKISHHIESYSTCMKH